MTISIQQFPRLFKHFSTSHLIACIMPFIAFVLSEVDGQCYEIFLIKKANKTNEIINVLNKTAEIKKKS